MPQQLANYVQTTLSVAMTNVSTTATLTSVAGLPTTGLFRLIIKDALGTYEIVEVASVNVGTGVVTFSTPLASGRGLEGTTAIAHLVGASVGNDITAYMLKEFPSLGQQGYAEVTATQGTFTALTDINGPGPGGLLAATITPSGSRRIRITCQIAASSSVAADVAQAFIREGSTSLQGGVWVLSLSSTVYTHTLTYITTPTNASHTYKISMQRAAGTGNITMQAGATFPAFILVEDIGSAL